MTTPTAPFEGEGWQFEPALGHYINQAFQAILLTASFFRGSRVAATGIKMPRSGFPGGAFL
jgi:hypothetical protein